MTHTVRPEWEKEFDDGWEEWLDTDFPEKCIKAFISRLLSDVERAERESTDRAGNALQLILPMAKAWAHQHDVGSNKKYIEHSEEVLLALTNPDLTHSRD